MAKRSTPRKNNVKSFNQIRWMFIAGTIMFAGALGVCYYSGYVDGTKDGMQKVVDHLSKEILPNMADGCVEEFYLATENAKK